MNDLIVNCVLMSQEIFKSRVVIEERYEEFSAYKIRISYKTHKQVTYYLCFL